MSVVAVSFKKKRHALRGDDEGEIPRRDDADDADLLAQHQAQAIVVDVFFFSSRRRHTRFSRDWSSDVCSSDLCPGARRRRPTSTGASTVPAADPATEETE